MEHLYQPIVKSMDIEEKYYDDIFQYIDKHSNYESLKNIETNFNLENTTLPLTLTIIKEFLGDKDVEITLNKGGNYVTFIHTIYIPGGLMDINGKIKIIENNTVQYKLKLENYYFSILKDELIKYINTLKKDNKVSIYLLCADVIQNDNKIEIKSFINLKKNNYVTE